MINPKQTIRAYQETSLSGCGVPETRISGKTKIVLYPDALIT